jgi:hypothetical protein
VRHINVDLVALVLAISLGLTMFMIALAAIINVTIEKNPTPTLGENTTQVFTAAIGGVIGVLGSYIGYRARNRSDNGKEG